MKRAKQPVLLLSAFMVGILFCLEPYAAASAAKKVEKAQTQKEPAAAQKESQTKNPVEPLPPPVSAGTPLVSPSLPDPAIAEIQKDLREILRVHQLIQKQYREEVREIQRITEQAQAHQKLLQELEAARQIQKVQAGMSPEEFIRLEKIRLIQEETRRNRTMIEEIQRQEK